MNHCRITPCSIFSLVQLTVFTIKLLCISILMYFQLYSNIHFFLYQCFLVNQSCRMFSPINAFSNCEKCETRFGLQTLDQLPLTHPEHFGTPVMASKKGFKRRRSNISGWVFLYVGDYESTVCGAPSPKKWPARSSKMTRGALSGTSKKSCLQNCVTEQYSDHT